MATLSTSFNRPIAKSPFATIHNSRALPSCWMVSIAQSRNPLLQLEGSLASPSFLVRFNRPIAKSPFATQSTLESYYDQEQFQSPNREIPFCNQSNGQVRAVS